MEEVPGHLTRMDAWKSVSAQSVSTGANILYLEGEALVTSYRHLLRGLGAHGARMVALVDNLPLALACAKGRARSRHLRSCLNQLCALSLATGSKLLVRWIASERNPADGLSRGKLGWFTGHRHLGHARTRSGRRGARPSAR
eukprot:8300308-Pyramimonas_sp.AAC.1